jgi:hypothetical protein
MRTFLKGSYATFLTSTNGWVQSRIIDIKNDSVLFREVIVRQVATPWGVPNLDTIATPLVSIHYSDIIGVPRGKESFSYIKNGTLPMIGGAGYILLNLVNGAYLNFSPFSKQNLPGVAVATGVFAAGFLLNKLHKPYIKFDKKYSLEYIRANLK